MSVEGAIGAIVGFAVGGPSGAQWGYAIGSALGGSGAPDQEGPRLNDLQIQDSSYGKPIPIIYGRDRIAGNIIWSKPLEEVKNEESAGKGGGPTSTTYNYFASFALGLCEGEITGVRRIWIANKLVYKYTDDATIEEILASNSQIDGITVYTGSESQDPDPLIQAHKGAANTPAFRGLAYLVFDRLDVGNSGQIPNITVEVVGGGSTTFRGKFDSFTIDVPDIGGGSPYIVMNKFYGDRLEIAASPITQNSYRIGFPADYRLDTYTLTGEQVEAGFVEDHDTDILAEADQEARHKLVDNLMASRFAERLTRARDQLLLCGVYNGAPVLIDQNLNAYKINAAMPVGNTSSTTTQKIVYGMGAVEFESASKTGDKMLGQDLTALLEDYGAGNEYISCVAGNRDDESSVNGLLYVFTSASNATPFTSTKYYKFELSSDQWAITEDGTCNFTTNQIEVAGCMENGHCILENESYIWGTAAKTLGGLEVTFLKKVGTTWTTYSTQNGTFTNATSTDNNGTLFPEVIGARDGLMVTATQNSDLGSSYRFNVYVYSRNLVVTTADVNLSTIVSDLCERAGLTTSDIDVTDLTDTVAGYTVSRVTSARKAIEPLMMAYFFDGAEFNNKLNFVKRGGSTVLTIPENDLGVDSEDLYKHTRQQEAELPSEVILDYKDQARDYQPGSQRSRRINTHVTNVAQVNAPIVMGADEAKQITEIHHYNSWVERDRFFLQVTQEYIDLNPTNVIQFTAEGDTRKARIVDISYGPMMKLELAAESGNYESDAVAGESESVEQTLGLIGPTNLQLLDIPLLRNQDNDTAIYAAASGYYNGYSGCRVFKSSDDVSYQEVDNLFETITQGYTTTVLADANHTSWDRTSSVTVKWTAGTAPGSITESNALKGARYFLIGDEIMVPVNETDNGDGTHTYDTFLRGRRGTDWATSEHATGERVILLDEAKMSRLAMVLSTQRYFKGVSIGNYLANAESETFTNTGVSLKPFSPTFIRGTRDGSNNLTITWINRSRYIGGALMPLPLFEDSESYKVEILDAPGGSVIRTLSPNPTTTTDTYSAADQTSDGLTLGDPVTVRISQYSATVGYGYTKEATV